MAVIGITVNKVISWHNRSWNTEGIKDLSPKNTYILIFGPSQLASLKFFENHFKGTILYKSPAAVCHLHKERPIANGGNIVVLFEWDEDTNPWGIPSIPVENTIKF